MTYTDKNVVIDNVLTDDEVSKIYESLESPYRAYVMEKYGQKVSDFWLPDSVLDKIVRHCELVSGVSGLTLWAYQFSRYERFVRDDGKTSHPNLTPHFDTFEEPRFTFDYQLGGNTTWPIVVEGKEFELNNNQAVTFAGTHQIHWRPKKVFEAGEYIDMIFCHLSLPEDFKNSEDHESIMKNREAIALEKFGELPWKM